MLTKLERLKQEVKDAKAAYDTAKDDYCYNYPAYEEAYCELGDAEYLLEKYLKEQQDNG